jgi:hypothetical protein
VSGRETWTAEEVVALRRRWGRVRAKVIAEALGKTVCAVIGKAHRLGLKRVPRVALSRFLRLGQRERADVAHGRAA